MQLEAGGWRSNLVGRLEISDLTVEPSNAATHILPVPRSKPLLTPFAC